MKRRKKNDYINNADFYEAMVKYLKECDEAEQSGEEIPRIPNYIGKCIFDIAHRLSYKPNFINYTYKDDMISDGIENAVAIVRNFDPEKSKNPFAYFTQVIYYAFIRRIQKEQKQQYIKHKVIENSVLTGTDVEQSDTGQQSDGAINLNNDSVNAFVENYEERMEKKKKKAAKKSGVEKFYDEDNE